MGRSQSHRRRSGGLGVGWAALIAIGLAAFGARADEGTASEAAHAPRAAESAATRWREIRVDGGITTWESERPGQPLLVFRARTVVEASVWDVLAVLEDVNRAAEWTAHCAEMRRLPDSTEDVMFVYARMDAPWPVRDRDVITRVRSVHAGPRELVIEIRSVPHAAIPEKSGVVRIPKLAASYRFLVLSSARTQVEYQIDVDPGGILPGWLKSMIAKDLAHDTLARLRDRVAWALQKALYRARAPELKGLAQAAGFEG